ncbi:Methionyl-tRNA formyltransferase [Candidatus Bealeia paramacronuclearis]|uniref:Methionyl-tRNA formyltransferase n=1 Tax=Candidatus Bealeia paramacronuclearis TaxID=1921001 RepID=A0ABZ2C4P6_9PROT|nr:Methionyl-tRNA formyltransferase [Candidatus Bealeia paramacronuclearis]
MIHPASLRVAFMGTPEFAVPALKALVDAGYQVMTVYSQPPRPKGRGYKLQESPVHTLAESLGIPVLTPTSLKTKDAQTEFQSLNLDIAVVAAYGLILPKTILESPKYGCLNIHGSLLPRWRGAAPIHRAILAGDSVTGVTIMEMNEGLDTGAMILKREIPILPITTTSGLHDEMAKVGAEALIETLPLYLEGVFKPIPQPEEGITYAAKIEKEEGLLTWEDSAEVLTRKVRALNPWPGVWFTYQGKRIKVFEAQNEGASFSQVPGTIVDSHLGIQTREGIFRPTRLQVEGGSPLLTEDFLRGHPIPKGTKL